MQIKLNTKCDNKYFECCSIATSWNRTEIGSFESKQSNQVFKTLFILRALSKYHSNIFSG